MLLERLIRILEVAALSGGSVSVSEICAATGYPKPSCYRLVQDLVTAGLLESSEKGLFSLGSRLHRISQLDRTDADIAAVAGPLLQDAANKYGVSCFLSRLRGTGVEITHVFSPVDARVSFLHPGVGFRPMHACSCAKVIAAYSKSETLDDLFGDELRKFTDFTQTEPNALRTELQSIRDQGYGECVQELEVGICSVAAPVYQENLGVALSVGATGSMRVLTESHRAEVGEALIKLALSLGDGLRQIDGHKSDSKRVVTK